MKWQRETFKEVIDDVSVKAENVEKVIFCTGKFYYDLLAKNEEIGGVANIAIVRIEQLYPLPKDQLKNIVSKYATAKKHVWAQEEPANMGAWASMRRHFTGVDLELISLRASGAPATGSSKAHTVRQTAIIDRVFENALVKS